jgi:hypothetical protein
MGRMKSLDITGKHWSRYRDISDVLCTHPARELSLSERFSCVVVFSKVKVLTPKRYRKSVKQSEVLSLSQWDSWITGKMVRLQMNVCSIVTCSTPFSSSWMELCKRSRDVMKNSCTCTLWPSVRRMVINTCTAGLDWVFLSFKYQLFLFDSSCRHSFLEPVDADSHQNTRW